MLDIPDQRKVHRQPTPLLGGVAVYLAFVVISLAFLRPVIPHQMTLLLLGAAAFGLIGLVDDLSNAGAWKLVAEAAVVVAIVWLGGFKIDLPWPYLGEVLAVLWIVGVANAFNCLDSTDGVAAGTAGIGALALTVLAVLAGRWGVAVGTAALAGASFGFLRYNFAPARIFLGDTGSLMLGFMLAAFGASIAVNHVSVSQLAALIVIFAVPVFDFLFVHLRRYRSGLNVLQLLTSTGKDHLPHRLLDQGLSQRQVALWIYRSSAVTGAIGVALFLSGPTVALMLVLAALSSGAYVLWWRAMRAASPQGRSISWTNTSGPEEALASSGLPPKP